MYVDEDGNSWFAALLEDHGPGTIREWTGKPKRGMVGQQRC